MSVLGTNLGQSVAGAGQAERTALREAAKKPSEKAKPKARDGDQLDLEMTGVESPDAIRSAKGNSQEETREDRQEKPGYGPGGQPAGKRLDVEG